MKKYEAMFIVSPEVSEQKAEEAVKELSQPITQDGGKVEAPKFFGKRKLAYRIKKKDEGLYYILEFEAEPKTVTKLDGIYNLKDFLIRYLITAKDK